MIQDVSGNAMRLGDMVRVQVGSRTDPAFVAYAPGAVVGFSVIVDGPDDVDPGTADVMVVVELQRSEWLAIHEQETGARKDWLGDTSIRYLVCHPMSVEVDYVHRV